MSRPKKFENSQIVSCHFETEMVNLLRELSALESLTTGRSIHMQDLIRDACTFVYKDGERMRESFRRSREHINRRIK